MAQIGEKEILQALSQVMDPDLNRDIVSLGFVKNMKIEGDAVAFDVELTTPACPVKDQLKQACIDVVHELGIQNVDVNMTAQVRSSAVQGRQQVPGIRNLIAIASGKGGVGKSTVCMNLALALAKTGARVGLMDCDLYGPSVPSMVGLHQRVGANEQQRLIPHEVDGLKVMSMGFMIDRTQAVSWRGPMLHKMLLQFLFNVEWGELDYLLLDMPPGTGDVQLSITQATPLAAAVLVTTPQNVALRDVEKGMEMFRAVKVPVLGIIENMSWFKCGKCDKKHFIFGQGGGNRMSERYKVPLLSQLPLDPSVPSDLGQGRPLILREPDSDSARAFSQAAGRVVAELSRQQWAKPSPGAMEV